MADDIRNLTRKYIAAFHARDLPAVAELMTDDFVLSDPENEALTPKESVLAFIEGLFQTSEDPFSFVARSILVDGNQSAIEFELVMGATRLEGVDIIDWRDGRMSALRAHLTVKD